MNQKDVFAGAQIVTQHPILTESAEKKRQYYAYLKKLIKRIKWDRRKYSKAQLSFYATTLCEGDTYKKRVKDWGGIQAYAYLFPFDIATILVYRKEAIKSGMISSLIEQIIYDFRLSGKAADILNLEFSAALGDEQAWDTILNNTELKRYAKYLCLIRDNFSFIERQPYTILITSTMSSGKSTLTNAFVGKNVSLAQNVATTSKIHAIVSKPFDDGVITEYDFKISLNATREELLTDNKKNKTEKLLVSTYFDGLLAGQRMVLYDTPGVNSSENSQHSEITRKILKAKQYKLLLYVLNATQLGTTDEGQHLDFVIKTAGRKKCLFIMNKIDCLISEDESFSEVIARQKEFLVQKGFSVPLICPISARAAFLAKKSKREKLSRLERREMESFIDKFELNSMAGYYEEELGCPPISVVGSESDDLYRNCGFAYMESIITKFMREK